MRIFAILALLLVSQIGHAQSIGQSLIVTEIYGVTASWPGECGPSVIDNRSAVSRQNTYHSIWSSGTGTWTATLNYSTVSCTGPFLNFGTGSAITNTSAIPIAFGFGNYPFIQVAVTGNAVVTYSAEKQLFIPPGGSGGGGGITDLQVTPTPYAVTYSASPTFDFSQGTYQSITLSGDATSPVFINGVPGRTYTVEICQDSIGGHQFLFPGNFTGNMTVGWQPLKCSDQEFKLNIAGSLYRAVGVGVIGQ